MSARTLIARGGAVGGSVLVPGDKSISHRAALLGALAGGTSEFTGFLASADCLATLAALERLGVVSERPGPGVVRIHGQGSRPFIVPDDALDLGNAGTGLRLMAGVLAGRGTPAVLTGDASLRARPMARIVEPLAAMGANISSREGYPPLKLAGGALRGMRHRMQMPSAQVKSCLLFAGLHADGETWIEEPHPTRDHTERLLTRFAIPVHRKGGAIGVTRADWDDVGGQVLAVPRDISSAAFFAVAAALIPGSEIRLPGVGLNPGRTGFLDVLQALGAEVEIELHPDQSAEPVGDLSVRGRELRGVHIQPAQVPGLIDEIPALLVAAACAGGRTVLSGAAELRVKESDRLAAMARGLEVLGIEVYEQADGVEIHGGEFRGGTVDAMHDHRIAMAFVMAGLRASGPIEIRNCAEIDTSFPGFVETARQAGLVLEVV